MSFGIVKDPGETEVKEVTISSLTLSPGDMLELNAGATAWTVADASTQHWQKKVVCIEPATSSDTKVKAIVVTDHQSWAVESANNSASADNGDRMILTDKNTVNNTGTDNASQNAIFIQENPVGDATDKKIIGTFKGGAGIDPDAA